MIRMILVNHGGKVPYGERLKLEERFAGAVEWAASHAPASGPFSRSPVVGALIFAYPVSPQKVSEFLSLAKSGEGLTAGSPVLTLTKFFQIPRATMRRREFSIVTLAATRAFIQSRKLVRVGAVADHGVIDYFKTRLGL